jgi:hypothetical protein
MLLNETKPHRALCMLNLIPDEPRTVTIPLATLILTVGVIWRKVHRR